MPEEEPSLNIPSLLTLAVVSFFVIRWFLKRDGSPDAGGPRTRGRGNIVDPAQVEQIAQMFPQLSTREIMWDLQRNGGNVAATTERILSGRGLDMPPPSFQPAIVLPSTTAAAAAAQPSSTSRASLKSDGEDLISRYNLSSKINGSADATSDQSSQRSTSGWSQSKEERQRLLQKRRDDMILAARRKMEQKQRQADNVSA
ncbi:hypothetical protein Aspvir_000729 [Aspergillus viridinutans]|uniref:Coupling of ubiquitin conjugation to ER degradation protein 1 n=1 Tax=Aspergillus viridinutans TaxID=75553 RepID=A0A9P3BMW5_ASPVI|nr:uncharacterized protein Aspvir_000729 [Aspergillus viridinutans]GIJ98611.1 hypothetical protein Aspvir_000729 [Aspergillus viridinutans]